MAPLTAVLGCTRPSGDIRLGSEGLQEVRRRPVAVFPWQDPGNGESTVRILPWGVAAACGSWGLGPGGVPTPRAAPREGPQLGQGSWPSLGGQQSLRSRRVKAALGGVVSQAGHTLGSQPASERSWGAVGGEIKHLLQGEVIGECTWVEQHPKSSCPFGTWNVGLFE